MAKRSPTDADRRISARVRDARMSAGLSQTALAGSLGISFQQVQKYEQGANRLSGGMLQAIAARIGVPVASFFDEAA